MTVEITSTPTRTENRVTFALDKALIPPGTGLSYPDRQLAQAHPVANAIFQVDGVLSVWILGNEIEVTKDEKTRWSSIKAKVIEAIKASVDG